MSSDDSQNAPLPSDRREAVREKAQQVQARQSRARLLRRSGLTLGAVAAVAAVAVLVVWTVASTAAKPQLSPANITDDGFSITAVTGTSDSQLTLGDAGAATPTATPESERSADATPEPTPSAQPAVAIHVYVDYLSPGAREWQVANVQQLSTWVNEGAATLSYHPVSMLTAKSNGTKYSLRAAGAAACVATYSPETFFRYNNDLLTRQPDVDSDGFSDTELADIAQAVGVDQPKQVRNCVEEGSFLLWAKSATERAVAGIPGTDGLALTGTPMILVNGQPYLGALDDAAEFSQFVLTSASDAFYRTQTETPAPTPTPPASPAPSPSATP